MRILLFNIRECEYYFQFHVYYFTTCDINLRSFYRLIIYMKIFIVRDSKKHANITNKGVYKYDVCVYIICNFLL